MQASEIFWPLPKPIKTGPFVNYGFDQTEPELCITRKRTRTAAICNNPECLESGLVSRGQCLVQHKPMNVNDIIEVENISRSTL